MKLKIDYKITRDEAKKISKEYCEQKDYSYEKLSTYDMHYGIRNAVEHHWTWSKSYEGPIQDENGYFYDLQTLPELILEVMYKDGKITVHEFDHIDLIRK